MSARPETPAFLERKGVAGALRAWRRLVVIGLVVIAGVGLLMSLSPSAKAAQWLLDHGVSTEGLFSDNRIMALVNTRDSVGVVGTASAALTRRTERSEVSLRPRFVTRHYWGDERLVDSEDYYVDSALSALGELWRVSTDLSWSKDTSSATEYGNDEIGVNNVPTRRERFVARPVFTYTLSERTRLSLQVGYENVDYANARRSSLTPYDARDGTVVLERALTERTAVNVSLSTQAFRPEDDRFGFHTDTDTHEARAGVSHALSETLSFNASVGGRKTKARLRRQGNTVLTSNSNGLVYGLNVEQQLERGGLKVALSRSIAPSATEGSIDRFDSQLTLFYRFSRHLSSSSSGRYRTEARPEQDTQDDRNTYFDLGTRLTWHFDPNWSVFTAFAHRAEKAARQSTRTRNEVYFGVSYSGEQIQW